MLKILALMNNTVFKFEMVMVKKNWFIYLFFILLSLSLSLSLMLFIVNLSSLPQPLQSWHSATKPLISPFSSMMAIFMCGDGSQWVVSDGGGGKLWVWVFEVVVVLMGFDGGDGIDGLWWWWRWWWVLGLMVMVVVLMGFWFDGGGGDGLWVWWWWWWWFLWRRWLFGL